MNRRYFLWMLNTIGFGLLVFPRLLFARHPKVRFYIAGVRFYDQPDDLTIDDPVVIKNEFWRRNRTRLAIYDHNGQKLGHVPERLAQYLGSHRIEQSRLININRHGLPWKRYRIETTLRS